jgi:hypothetical protein
MEKVIGIIMASILVILISLYITTRPNTYVYDGVKYVEYHNGKTCSYHEQDKWNTLPFMCAETAQMRRIFRYR